MMDLSQRKEQFSRAYVHAVASVAGFTLHHPAVDDDSIDLAIAGRIDHDIPRPPRIEIQLKCTADKIVRGKHLVYSLKRKNYDDLRLVDLVVPRMLVIVLVPDDELEWVHQSEEELSLRRCAYWVSLRGLDETTNRRSVSIRLSRQNLFSVEALRGLMRRAGQREPL
jgi:hypothetical protein